MSDLDNKQNFPNDNDRSETEPKLSEEQTTEKEEKLPEEMKEESTPQTESVSFCSSTDSV